MAHLPGPDVITRVLARENKEGQNSSRRYGDRSRGGRHSAVGFEDKTRLSQGLQVASRSWKRTGNGFFPTLFRRNAALPTKFKLLICKIITNLCWF